MRRNDAPRPAGESRLVWIALGFLALFQLAALPGDYVGFEHDDAEYVLASLGLLRGEYRLGVSPGNPPLTHLTPGLPLLLVPAAFVFSNSFLPFHLTMWAILVLCDALVFLWLRRRLDKWGAVLGTALFGFNPLVVARAGAVMPEMPMLALTLALFLAAEDPAWTGWGSGALVAAAAVVRQRALALLPAAVLWHGVGRKDWKAAGQAVCGPLAAIVLWRAWLWRSKAPVYEVGIISHALSGPMDLLRSAASNAAYYIELWGRLWLPIVNASRPVELAYGIALLVVAGLGAERVRRKRPCEPALVWAASAGILYLLLPFRFERYLLLFIPILAWLVIEGFLRILWRTETAMVAVALAVAMQVLGQDLYLLKDERRRSKPELAETYGWIQANVPAHESLSSLWYARDALHTARPVAPLPGPLPPGELPRWFRARGVGYVLMQDLPADALGASMGEEYAVSRGLLRLRAQLDAGFRAMYRNPIEKTAVFSVPRLEASPEMPR